MNDELIEELTEHLENMSMSEKIKVNKFVKNIQKYSNYDENINDIILEFSKLEVSKNENVINKFYIFVNKCIIRDRKYINSTIFTPPEPPMCK